MGGFTRSLTRQQDYFQRRRQLWPKHDELSIAEYPFTTSNTMFLYAGARVGGDDFLPHGPAENCASRGENLICQDGRRDRRDGGLDVCSPDAADVELGPPWQQVSGNERVRLAPALVALFGVL